MERSVPTSKVSRLMGLSKEANLGMSQCIYVYIRISQFTKSADKHGFLLHEANNHLCSAILMKEIIVQEI